MTTHSEGIEYFSYRNQTLINHQQTGDSQPYFLQCILL